MNSIYLAGKDGQTGYLVQLGYDSYYLTVHYRIGLLCKYRGREVSLDNTIDTMIQVSWDQ